VSVVIPCHNAEAWLGQTLGSLLDQTLLPAQVVVVDDASTDGSRAVAEAFAASDPGRFDLVSAVEPGSASRTRNLGASLLREDAEAVMFLDADDVLSPDSLASLAEALRGHERGIALGPWRRMELDGGRWWSRPRSCPDRPAGGDPIDAWLTGWYHPPCAVLWSIRSYRATGGWDPMWCVNDDGNLMLRALVEGEPLRMAERGVAYYRRLPDADQSLSGRRSTERGLASRLGVVSRIGLRLEQAGRIERHRAAVAEACWIIRRDALGVSDRVRAEAEALGRRYALPRWRRAIARPLLAEPASEPADEPDVEVRRGLDRAERVLASQTKAASISFGPPPATPTVSVVVPTYQRPDATIVAIDSVLQQSFADLEVWVIDDASEDDTVARLSQLRDPRLHIDRLPRNAGVAAARNEGIRRARGKYLAFLDSDDRWLPEKLAKQVALIESLPDDCAMVYSGMEIDAGDASTRTWMPTARGDIAKAMLRENLVQPGGSGPLMRRSAVATVGYFDPRLPAIEDWDYWLRLAQLFAVEYVPEVLCVYDDRDGPARRSRQWARNLRAREMFFDKHQHALRRAGLASAFLRETAERCLRPTVTDPRAARRLARRAVSEQPTDAHNWGLLKWTITAGRPSKPDPDPRPGDDGGAR
jgi:glycosyltransferase involved in cell wall biosynthesis